MINRFSILIYDDKSGVRGQLDTVKHAPDWCERRVDAQDTKLSLRINILHRMKRCDDLGLRIHKWQWFRDGVAKRLIEQKSICKPVLIIIAKVRRLQQIPIPTRRQNHLVLRIFRHERNREDIIARSDHQTLHTEDIVLPVGPDAIVCRPLHRVLRVIDSGIKINDVIINLRFIYRFLKIFIYLFHLITLI